MDYIEEIITIFKQKYEQKRNAEYISVGAKGQSAGKDRKAVGTLLKFFKEKLPNAKSADIKEKFSGLFDACLSIEDSWLRDNMSLSLISSKINEIIQTLQNGNRPNQPRKPQYRGYTGDNKKWGAIYSELEAEQLQATKQITSGKSVARIGSSAERGLAP